MQLLTELLTLSNKFIIPGLQLYVEQLYAKRLSGGPIKDVLVALALSYRLNKGGVLRHVSQHYCLVRLREAMDCDYWKEFIKQEDEIVGVLMLSLAEDAKDTMKLRASNTSLQLYIE